MTATNPEVDGRKVINQERMYRIREVIIGHFAQTYNTGKGKAI